MPEEVNRLVADRVSDLFLCASQTAVMNLSKEGIHEGVHWVGDVAGCNAGELPLATEIRRFRKA
jgi:UDP-N-acetylglucosamine 2-epimerase